VELLPDLYQHAPFALAVAVESVNRRPQFRLGFSSAVDNIGQGPLIIVGRRSSNRLRTMSTNQVIELENEGLRQIRVAGGLTYERSADHEHWHLLPFERYELRRANGAALVGRDRKVGFCLGDRYASSIRAPLGPPVFVDQMGDCGAGKPSLLEVREGISPGFGDEYVPQLEGQYVDVTGLPAGRYSLVHRVNAERVLRESDYRNNVAAALIELTWPRGMEDVPHIETLRTCTGTARCSA